MNHTGIVHLASLPIFTKEFLSSGLLHSQHVITSRAQWWELNCQSQAESSCFVSFNLAIPSQMSKTSSQTDSQPFHLGSQSFLLYLLHSSGDHGLILFSSNIQHYPGIHISSHDLRSMVRARIIASLHLIQIKIPVKLYTHISVTA